MVFPFSCWGCYFALSVVLHIVRDLWCLARARRVATTMAYPFECWDQAITPMSLGLTSAYMFIYLYIYTHISSPLRDVAATVQIDTFCFPYAGTLEGPFLRMHAFHRTQGHLNPVAHVNINGCQDNQFINSSSSGDGVATFRSHPLFTLSILVQIFRNIYLSK